MRAILAALTLATVSACTTIPPEERAAACRSTDWQRYGVNDGLLGVPEDARTSRFADCADLGAPVDLAAYRAGRTEGLLSYCTAENGYRVAYEGRRYRGACPPALEPDFRQGYALGRRERPGGYFAPTFGFGFGFGRRGFRPGIHLGWGAGRYRHGPCWSRWYRRCW